MDARSRSGASCSSWAPSRAVEPRASCSCWRRPPTARSPARTGSSSPSWTASGFWPCARAASESSSPGTATTQRPRSPRSCARWRRCRSPRCCSTGRWWRSTMRDDPASSGCKDEPDCARPIDIRHATVRCPVTYYGFDLLGFEDFDLRGLPLTSRKAILRRVLPPAGALRYLEHVEDDGEALYQEAERLGLEGIVGKKADRTLQGGTLPPLAQGPRPPERRLRGGRLHRPQGLARWVRRPAPGRFRERHADLRRPRRQRLHRPPAGRRASSAGGERPRPPCVGPVPAEKGTVWVEPTMVAEVEFTERTDEDLLRQPVFLRFRDDKRPEECIRRRATEDEPKRGGASRQSGRARSPCAEVTLVPSS